MKGLCRLALAALFVAACSGGDGDITGPNSRDQLMQVPDDGVLAIGVDSTTGASITTNKDDYSPGEIVHVVGQGWAPGETVNLHMTENPDTHADVDTNVVADASGGFSIHYYDVQTHDLGVTFTLTATGQTSRSVAVATFTDGNVSIKSSPAGVPSFTTGSYVKYNQSQSCGMGTTSPGAISANSSTFTIIVGISNNQSLSMTVPATLPGYVFSSWSVGSPGIVVSGSLTNPSGLCIRIPAANDQPNITVNYIVSNVAPTVDAGGAYSGAEGSAISLGGVGGATATDADGDALTYKWTANTTGIDGGGACTFSPSDQVLNPSVTCTDDSQGAPGGKFTLTLEVKDGAGGHTVTDNADLTVTNVAPTATINAPSPVNPGQNFTVTLNGGTDLGTNDIPALQYAFDCGDGAGYNAFGAANSRSCTASQPNSQTVKGKIRDQDGGENEYTTTVSVNNAAPVANAGGNKSGVEGSPVSLIGTGSTDSDGTITTYAWTYAVVSADPGADCVITNAGMATASITCDDDGSFTVTLTVTDDDGATNSQTVTLTLTNANPTVIASGGAGAEGAAIQLGATGDDPGDNDVAGLSYAWTVNSTGIDAGGSCTLSSATAEDPTVTCTDDSNLGNFTVTVTVNDGDGGSASSTANLTVTNANPVASAQNASGPEASVIQLNATGNDPGDNDDAGLTYAWTINTTGIDAGGQCNLSSANIQNPTVTCTDDSNNGTFTVSVTVSDDDGGSHTDNATLTVTNANPSANAHGPYSGVEGSPIALTGTGDDPAPNDDGALTYLWSVNTAGMDPGAACTFSPNATAQNPTVTCNDDTNGGNVSLTLKVMDDDGGSGTQLVNLSVTNANPTANPGGPYSGNEGSAIQLNGAGDDPGNNDDGVLTYQWTVSASGIDAGGACTLNNATLQNPTVTCTDDSNGGNFTVSLTVKDDDGGTSTTQTSNLTVANVNPVADANGPYTGNEGANVSLTGSKSDAGSNDSHTFGWAWVAQSGVDPGASCSFTTATQLSPTVKCTDDGVFKLTLTVTDDDTGAHSDDATLTLSNVNPTIAITSHVDGALFSLLNGPLSVTGAITEAGTNDTHQCRLELNGVIDVTGAYSSATGLNCSPSVLPAEAGVYTLTIRVTDDDFGEGTASIMIVVYDPSAGFVTGGGWINSPLGAYKPNTSLTGKANFGFVSKYKRGATVPDGNTEFQFHAAGMNFHSESYEWLVVNQAGTNAQFKGVGTINGQGSYTFMLWATDNGNSGDTFRIKITNNATNLDVYDNGIDQVIANGSIVIHTGAKK